MQKIYIFFLMLSLMLFLVNCTASEKSVLPIPPIGLLDNAQAIAVGRELFAAHCAECHGGLAEGRTLRAARFNPAAPDFQELRYRTALPDYLYLRIWYGKNMEPFGSSGSVMPPWNAYLTEEQVWSLVAFIRDRAGLNSAR